MARIYRFDDVEIDLQGFRLRKGAQPLAVEPKVLQLLVYLVENPGRLMARRELIDAVWSGSFVTDHVLNRAIGQLRKLLGDDANERVTSRPFPPLAIDSSLPSMQRLPNLLNP